MQLSVAGFDTKWGCQSHAQAHFFLMAKLQEFGFGFDRRIPIQDKNSLMAAESEFGDLIGWQFCIVDGMIGIAHREIELIGYDGRRL